jgi:hypothetical protein
LAPSPPDVFRDSSGVSLPISGRRVTFDDGRACGVTAITGRRERTKRKSLRRLKV